MDICLEKTNGSIQIHPLTIHGMLWLQTHFNVKHWKALAESRVKLPLEDSEMLFDDACKAGVNLSYMSKNELTESFKFRNF